MPMKKGGRGAPNYRTGLSICDRSDGAAVSDISVLQLTLKLRLEPLLGFRAPGKSPAHCHRGQESVLELPASETGDGREER